VILSWVPRDGQLINQIGFDHTQSVAGAIPILAIDMYEHAYHIDFGTNAQAYIATFMRNIDWNAVIGRCEDAIKVAPPRPLYQKEFANVPAVTPEEVKAMIEAGEGVQIIDARPRHYTTKSSEILAERSGAIPSASTTGSASCRRKSPSSPIASTASTSAARRRSRSARRASTPATWRAATTPGRRWAARCGCWSRPARGASRRPHDKPPPWPNGVKMESGPLVELALFGAAAFAAAFVAGLAGFAFGLVAMAIWLHLLTPAQTAILIMFYALVIQGYAVWKLRHALKLRRLLPFVIGGLLGVPLGVELLRVAPAAAMRTGIGVFMVVFSLYSLFKPAIAPVKGERPIADGSIGVLSGIVAARPVWRRSCRPSGRLARLAERRATRRLPAGRRDLVFRHGGLARRQPGRSMARCSASF
jgi:hypothetical protein